MTTIRDPREPQRLAGVSGVWSVWYKPPGLLAVPDRTGSGSSLLDRVRENGVVSPRTLGRLDRAACGLMLLAESAAAQRRLSRLWDQADAVKAYDALVLAAPPQTVGVIALPIAPGRRGAMRVGHGKPARTRYETATPCHDFERVRLWIETGRRHQIRVHLAAIGAPIVGDTRYRRLACRVGGYTGSDLQPRPATAIALCCRHIQVPEAAVDVSLDDAAMDVIWDTVIAMADPDSVQS